MRSFGTILAAFAALSSAPARATTLERLSLGDMIAKSTSIVHAKVTSSYSALVGADIYTYYQLQVSEVLKLSGQSAQSLQVAVPGGTAKGWRQIVPGAHNHNWRRLCFVPVDQPVGSDAGDRTFARAVPDDAGLHRERDPRAAGFIGADGG